MYLKELKIGNVNLENNLILAPMAGVTDLPFRIICKKYGKPGLLCNEMVSAKAICYEDEKTKAMLSFKKEERPISMQIFGNEPEFMGKAAKSVSEISDILDINMGCPAPKVVKNGDGSKLLLNLELVEEIVKEVVKNSEKPVTVKIRKGWDNDHIVAIEAAKIIEKAGASAIIIHGRTREEFYTGQADWDIIKQVKDSVKIPVIGNGDVKNEEDAKRMFEETGVDGIMIGRASLGNPWIFKQIAYYLENEEKMPEITSEEKQKVIEEHFNLLLQEKGEYVATREIRKHIAWYVKGLKNASVLRDAINQTETAEQFFKMTREYFASL
jgi:tRNA-dihydrouridine synthase B